MINEKQAGEILSLYQRHGWKLRRVLLTEDSRARLAKMFDSVEIRQSEIDALWFSRSSGAESETWELRHLSENPYALLEIFDLEDEEIREEICREIEEKLKNTVER